MIVKALSTIWFIKTKFLAKQFNKNKKIYICWYQNVFGYLKNFVRFLTRAFLIRSNHHKCSPHIAHINDGRVPWPNITFPWSIKVSIWTAIKPPTTVIMWVTVNRRRVLVVCGEGHAVNVRNSVLICHTVTCKVDSAQRQTRQFSVD